MLRRTLFVLLFSALVFTATARNAAAEYTEYDSLTYAYVGGRPLHLALFIPADATPAHPVPCVVWIHGGGWEGGAYLPLQEFLMDLVVERGIAIASVEYRLTSQRGYFGSQPVIFPAQIQDVKGAVRWLRAHADTYHLDPEHFGSWGNSAGGHLSALLATSGGVPSLEGSVGGNLSQSSRVQVFAEYNAPTDILHLAYLVTDPPGCVIDFNDPSSATSHLIGWDGPGQGMGDILKHDHSPWGPYPGLLALSESANPITWIDPSDPPGTISHGDQDTTVPLNASRIFDDALSAAGVPHEFHIVPGVGHGDLGEPIHHATMDFLAAHLMTQTAVGTSDLEPATGPLAVSPSPCAGPCRFSASQEARGSRVEIADVAGRHIRSLVIGLDGTASWDGRDVSGRLVPPGLYFAKFVSGPQATARATHFVVLR